MIRVQRFFSLIIQPVIEMISCLGPCDLRGNKCVTSSFMEVRVTRHLGGSISTQGNKFSEEMTFS